MGLFDRFGVGGGKVSIQLAAPRVAAGGQLQGSVVFTGGKRAQKITAIKVGINCNQVVVTHGQNGPEKSTQSKAIVQPMAVSPAFTTQPGQAMEFPFALPLPPGLYSTAPGQVDYRVTASADIDGEIDPGASAEFHVDGAPAPALPAMGAMGAAPGMYPQGGAGYVDPNAKNYAAAMNQGYVDPNAKNYAAAVNQGYVDPNAKGWVDPNAKGWVDPNAKGYVDPNAKGWVDPNAKQAGMLAVGAAVVAQWQDGNWYPGTIVAMQNGMYGVDWSDKALGASSWVGAHQVQPDTQAKAAPAYGYDAGVKGAMKGADGGAFVVGSRVMAQWQDGNWYPGTVVALNSGMFGVDWDNPALGASTWVSAGQLVPGQ